MSQQTHFEGFLQDPEDNGLFLSQDQWSMVRKNGKYDIVIIGSGFCSLSVVVRALKNDPKVCILILEQGSSLYREHYRNLPLPHGNLLDTTFPWSISERTSSGELGTITSQRGTVPYFGGKSTMWNAWCPRPLRDEMQGWPEETIDAAFRNFVDVEDLLEVQKANQIHPDAPSGGLQNTVDRRLQEAVRGQGIQPIYRAEPAPLSLKTTSVRTDNFQRFSIPSPMLELVHQQKIKNARGGGGKVDIVCNCCVEKILEKEGTATGLQTSRGELLLGGAKLVLALGTIPGTTLVRNSFLRPNVGNRFTSHFKSMIIARTPIYEDMSAALLQMATTYIAGKSSRDQQFHIQMSCLSNQQPEVYQGERLKYMPDDVAYATPEESQSFKGYVIFVCSVVGEMNSENPNNWVRDNPNDADLTKNSLLQIESKTTIDEETWEEMDQTTFDLLNNVFKNQRLEYWIKMPDGTKEWCDREPTRRERRATGVVHESSTMYVGKDERAPVGTDYRLRNTQNVYVTGGALWPRGGSWNPTLTMCALAMDLADRLNEQNLLQSSET